MTRTARTAFIVVATACLAGLGTGAATAETPNWVPEPTPAGFLGSASISLCANIPTPIPFVSFNICL